MKKFAKFTFWSFVIATVVCIVFVNNYGKRGSGVQITEQRLVEPFQKVALAGIGTANIRFGDVQDVQVTVDDNLIEFVETAVRNGQLEISTAKAINPSFDLTIDIVIPRLTQVEVAGKALVTIDEFDGDTLTVELAGACGIQATGRVGKLDLELAGACRARLKSLKADHVVVEVAGACGAEVFANESLKAEAAGFCSIACHGNPPQVRKERAGLCRITLAE